MRRPPGVHGADALNERRQLPPSKAEAAAAAEPSKVVPADEAADEEAVQQREI